MAAWMMACRDMPPQRIIFTSVQRNARMSDDIYASGESVGGRVFERLPMVQHVPDRLHLRDRSVTLVPTQTFSKMQPSKGNGLSLAGGSNIKGSLPLLAAALVGLLACGDEDVSGIPSGFIDYYAIKGTVTDATGAPVAGATVEAVEIFSVESPQLKWDDCGEGQGIALVPVDVTVAGTFHFSGGTRISFFCIFAVAKPPEGRSLLPDTGTIQDVIFSDFNPPLDTMRLDFVLISK